MYVNYTSIEKARYYVGKVKEAESDGICERF
jgi:hypothetical protein